MKILHHGATDGVTGSCHELRLSQSGILIDCGLFQGAEASPSKSAVSDSDNELLIDFPVDHIKALVVTHVHIDHVGRIPHLIAAGFRGPIYCSEPSAKLLPLVLEDALKIGVTRNRRLIEMFLQYLSDQLRPIAYKRWINILDDESEKLELKLKPAGHILGSAYVEFRARLSDTSVEKVVFSGDLGAPYSPLLNAPKAPYSADRLIIESTYGDRNHSGRRLRREALRQIVGRAVADQGTVLIPAFSIGRTQELLYELEDIIHRSKGKGSFWSEIDIIVDSPLASRFTEVYRTLSRYWDKEAKAKKRGGRHPLSFEQLLTVESHEDHNRVVHYLQQSGRPAIVIAASGMCAGGRVVNYLKALVGDPRTDIVFVGYQARGTAGRDIQKYGPRGGWVELDGERYDIAAQVHSLSGYSAHADQKDLINFVKRMRFKPKEIRIVHGDSGAKTALKALFEKMLPDAKVIIPI